MSRSSIQPLGLYIQKDKRLYVVLVQMTKSSQNKSFNIIMITLLLFNYEPGCGIHWKHIILNLHNLGNPKNPQFVAWNVLSQTPSDGRLPKCNKLKINLANIKCSNNPIVCEESIKSLTFRVMRYIHTEHTVQPMSIFFTRCHLQIQDGQKELCRVKSCLEKEQRCRRDLEYEIASKDQLIKSMRCR